MQNQTNHSDTNDTSNNAQDKHTTLHTRQLNEQDLEQLEATRRAQAQLNQQPEEPLREGVLRLQLVDLNHAITLPIKDNILLGRPDPVTSTIPDVDFTHLAGYRMGVSRRHAEIHWYHDNRLMLYDLGSSNGTFLNGKRLDPNQAYPIYNGDEIRLGQLALYIYYEIKGEGTFIPFRDSDF